MFISGIFLGFPVERFGLAVDLLASQSVVPCSKPRQEFQYFVYILRFSRMIGDADISEVICSKPRLLNFIYILISYNISKIVGDAGILC